MTIGEKIKQRRKELGISINELAKCLQKDRATIYRYESNEINSIPVSILEPLAKILQTTPAFLCSHEHIDALEQKIANEKKAFLSQEDLLSLVENESIGKLILASQNMTQEQIAHILKYAIFMYPEAFENN